MSNGKSGSAFVFGLVFGFYFGVLLIVWISTWDDSHIGWKQQACVDVNDAQSRTKTKYCVTGEELAAWAKEKRGR